MIVDHFDAAVIGAGPAGSCAAYHLARVGLRVALIDRARFPRDKVCGDGITPRALVQIHAMGLIDEVLEGRVLVPALRTIDLRTGHVSCGPPPSRAAVGPAFGTVVPRVALDDMLQRAATSAGACPLESTEIRGVCERNGGHHIVLRGYRAGGAIAVSSRVVVVADGATGVIGRSLRPTPRRHPAGFAVRQYVRVAATTPAFTICAPICPFGQAVAGYGWVFPLGPELVNVGVGLLTARADPADLRVLFGDMMRRLRRVDPNFAHCEPIGRLAGGALRTGLDLGSVVRPGILIAGDAAAVTNPFTGEGIAQALESGRAAAASIIDHFSSGQDVAEGYRSRLQTAFPETARCEGSLSWIAERGGLFPAELWELASQRRLVGRALRRVALEEPCAPLAEAGHGAVEAARLASETWALFEQRHASERPLMTQFLAAVRGVDGGRVETAMRRYWSVVLAHHVAPTTPTWSLGVAFAHVCLLVQMASDTTRDPCEESRTRWVADALAIGLADLLVASLFECLAEVDSHTAAGASEAVVDLLGEMCTPAHDATSSDGALLGLAEELARVAQVAEAGARAAPTAAAPGSD